MNFSRVGLRWGTPIVGLPVVSPTPTRVLHTAKFRPFMAACNIGCVHKRRPTINTVQWEVGCLNGIRKGFWKVYLPGPLVNYNIKEFLLGAGAVNFAKGYRGACSIGFIPRGI